MLFFTDISNQTASNSPSRRPPQPAPRRVDVGRRSLRQFGRRQVARELLIRQLLGLQPGETVAVVGTAAEDVVREAMKELNRRRTK